MEWKPRAVRTCVQRSPVGDPGDAVLRAQALQLGVLRSTDGRDDIRARPVAVVEGALTGDEKNLTLHAGLNFPHCSCYPVL